VAQILALGDDLFFQAKMVETAKQLGVEMKSFAAADALLAAFDLQQPKLVVVDLSAQQSPVEAIKTLRARAPQIPLLAFFSHVQTELSKQAWEAGCADVMPRSKFTKHLPAIFSRTKD
jgi:CheY-like chemotaxis protein